LVRRYFKRPRLIGRAGRRLRIRGGSRRRETNVSFGVLDDLMNVSVEHGHCIEALQQTEDFRAVFSGPAPGRYNAYNAT